MPLRPVLIIGKIGRAHGLQGEVRIQPMTNDPGRFCELNECLLVSPDEKILKEARCASARVFPEQVLLRLQGYDTRESAETINGWLLAVKRENAVSLPEDTWFICDLLGCSVYDERRGLIGELADVMQNAAQDVYVVRMPGQQDLLFPALKIIIKNVDLQERRIDVQLPDGLYEVYRGDKT